MFMPLGHFYYSSDSKDSDSLVDDTAHGVSTGKGISRGRLMSFLPPCRICGDRASGFHYGANTCEACKGFFRRSIVRKQKDENFKYRCLNAKMCILTGGKLRLCAYCRYQKCLEIGMSKGAIKQGRYTHERRTRYINEVKNNSDDGVKSEFTSSIYEDSDLITRLLSVQLKHINKNRADDFNIYKCASEHNKEPDDKTAMRNVVTVLENSVTVMVEFMRCVPGFLQLHLHDQTDLLKGSHSDFFLLGEIHTPVLHHPTEDHHHQFIKYPVHLLYSFSKFHDVCRFMEKSKQLNITREEMCLLQAIAVLSTDRADLIDPQQIEGIQWQCVNCLRYLLNRSYVNPSQRLWRLLERITTLRTLSPDY